MAAIVAPVGKAKGISLSDIAETSSDARDRINEAVDFKRTASWVSISAAAMGIAVGGVVLNATFAYVVVEGDMHAFSSSRSVNLNPRTTRPAPSTRSPVSVQKGSRRRVTCGLRAEVIRRFEAGETIRMVAQETGLGKSTVLTLLKASDVVMSTWHQREVRICIST